MDASKKQSNIDRARWNVKCRQKLAEHIAKLGIHLEPVQVRLITTYEDDYMWESLPETQHLFIKNLSDHSMRALKDLYHNVGVTFQAVRRIPEAPCAYSGQGIFSATQSGPKSFTSQINDLEIQNSSLSEQLQAMRLQLEQEEKQRMDANEQLQLEQKRRESLQKELQAVTRGQAHFRNLARKYSHGVAKLEVVFSHLQEISNATQDGFEFGLENVFD